MPGGHQITFTWGNGTTAPTNRIYTAADNGSRTVTYGYTSGNLTAVTSPGGRTTKYGYGTALAGSGWSGPIASSLMTSITDPRGLTTLIEYAMNPTGLNPNLFGYSPTPIVYWEQDPNGVTTQIIGLGVGNSQYSLGSSWSANASPTLYNVYSGGYGGTLMFAGEIGGSVSGSGSPATVSVVSADLMGATSFGGLNFQWTKNYDYWTEDLLQEIDYTYPWVRYDLHTARQMAQTNMEVESVETDNTWNFQGNPLSKSTIETITSPTGTVNTGQTNTTQYAYWDATRYYQQKAVVDPAGRVSYTDYYQTTAAAGSKGQKLYIYDPKNSTFTNTPPSSNWKTLITPTNASTYCGTFVYDSKGRTTDVWKLQKTTTTPWTYVQTHSTFGADNSPTWGQTTQMIEDYGGIGRATANIAPIRPGVSPSTVSDAAGHTFVTSYDNDQNVLSITRTDVIPNQPLVINTYGVIGITNGMPMQVTDGLTGVTEALTYQGSGGGIGQISEVAQSGGMNLPYMAIYSYSIAGDRALATYTTADGTISWQYGDYEEVGTADSPKRAPQTITKLNGASLTAEELDYQYDSAGCLTGAAFAQTPDTGFTPSGSNPWYDSSHPAQSRARGFFAHDAAGRVLASEHYWDTLTSGTTTYGMSQTLLADECVYDATLGLKTTSTFYDQTSGSPTSWTQTRQETYGYDPQLDFVTNANYGDGLPNATPVWAYDAAGNRTDSITDNLNRTTSISGTSVTSDILGNRTALGSSTSYSWDCIGRMKGLTTSATTTSYEYRADGMRTHKAVGSENTEYYHDAQMPVEDALINGTSLTVTRYGLGARGVDYEEQGVGTYTSPTSRSPGAFSNVVFPIYDAHGNMTATLSRYSSNSYAVNNQRSYDTWGIVRSGATTSDPKNRYCGNLGHQQDDESGLVYMRARYYEPTSGRFISQDLVRNGFNWS